MYTKFGYKNELQNLVASLICFKKATGELCTGLARIEKSAYHVFPYLSHIIAQPLCQSSGGEQLASPQPCIFPMTCPLLS